MDSESPITPNTEEIRPLLACKRFTNTSPFFIISSKLVGQGKKISSKLTGWVYPGLFLLLTSLCPGPFPTRDGAPESP